MKRLYGTIALAAVSLLSFTSCEDFMDIHEDFIEGGEIIYAPKPDSVSFIAGKGRIEFRCWTYNAPNVKSIDLYWNSGADSLIIPVTMKTGLDSIKVELPNMEEKSYTFDITTRDNFGHKSLKVTDFGSSYGDLYVSTLADRRIKKVSLKQGEATVEWYSSQKGLVRNEVRYTTNNGGTAIAAIPSNQHLLSLPNPKAGSEFEYRSLYIPEAECIDTFSTAWVKGNKIPEIFVYDRSNWSVLEVSDETASDGGGKNTLIDGDLGSYWHSQWDGGNAPLPHWAIIDMAEAIAPVQFDIYRRPGNTDANHVEVYVSDVPDAGGEWTKVAEGQFTSGDKVTLKVANKTKGRYLKLLLPDSNRAPFTSIAEIYAYGA